MLIPVFESSQIFRKGRSTFVRRHSSSVAFFDCGKTKITCTVSSFQLKACVHNSKVGGVAIALHIVAKLHFSILQEFEEAWCHSTKEGRSEHTKTVQLVQVRDEELQELNKWVTTPLWHSQKSKVGQAILEKFVRDS